MTKEDINRLAGAPLTRKVRTAPPKKPPVPTHHPPAPPVAPVNVSSTTAKAIQDNAKQLGLTWTLRPATVKGVPSTGAQNNNVQIIYDGDSVAITAQSLIGIPANDSRVMGLMVPPSGNFILGSLENNPQPGSVIARAYRASFSSGSTGTEQPYLRLDNVSIQKGNTYFIQTGPIFLDASVANDVGRAIIRVATGGVTATTGSTQLQLAQAVIPNTSLPEVVSILFSYNATVDDTLSILLSVTRAAGTGTIQIQPTGNSPVEMFVIQGGTDPGDTGIPL